jgi:glycerol-3-phosphate acyltransferase PlsY
MMAAHFLFSPVLGSVVAAVACILGHNYTIWLGFKGGKGIATSAGVALALFPVLIGFCSAFRP